MFTFSAKTLIQFVRSGSLEGILNKDMPVDFRSEFIAALLQSGTQQYFPNSPEKIFKGLFDLLQEGCSSLAILCFSFNTSNKLLTHNTQRKTKTHINKTFSVFVFVKKIFFFTRQTVKEINRQRIRQKHLVIFAASLIIVFF